MSSDVRQGPAYTQTHTLTQMDCIWLVVMGPSLLKWHQAALGIVHYRAAHVKARPGKAINQWFRIHKESNGSKMIWIRAATTEYSRLFCLVWFFLPHLQEMRRLDLWQSRSIQSHSAGTSEAALARHRRKSLSNEFAASKWMEITQ